MSLTPALPPTTATPATNTTSSSGNNNNNNNNNEEFDIIKWQQDNNISIDTRYTTEDVRYDESVTFQSMGLHLPILKGIADLGYRAPSPVQAQAIPAILLGNDVVCRGKTGTGKTLALAAPIVQMIDTNKQRVQALIITPTRELVIQLSDFLTKLTKHLSVKVLGSYGGSEFRFDRLALDTGVHILVATTGRAESIAKLGFLRDVKVCALDEADKLFAPNCIQQTEMILTQCLPHNCQKLLFSATFPQAMANDLRRLLPNAEMVNTMDDITLRGVTQHYIVVEEKDKLRCLKQLLDLLQIDQCIIFCCSPQRADAIAQRMTKKWGLPCFSHSGALQQSERIAITREFRNKRFKYLVATDVMSRGFDLSSINVVINFDLPNSTDTYLHRVGRSGRFGHLGLAVNFVHPSQNTLLREFEVRLDTYITRLPDVIDHNTYSSEVQQKDELEAATAEAAAAAAPNQEQ